MPHLDPERLAAFDHDAPSPEEQAHLTSCAHCAREQLAFARFAEFARSPGELAVGRAPRLTEWEALSAQLRVNGLLTRPGRDDERPVFADAAAVVPPLRRPTPSLESGSTVAARPAAGTRRSWSAILRLAAAIGLMATGVAVGRASAGSDDLSGFRQPVAVGAVTSEPSFASVDEASRVLNRAQLDYQRASIWLSSHDTTVHAQTVYRARLAALEQMMTASRAGLYEAPQDPVLNQYYLAAYTAREVTLRQLGASLPVDRVMESF